MKELRVSGIICQARNVETRRRNIIKDNRNESSNSLTWKNTKTKMSIRGFNFEIIRFIRNTYMQLCKCRSPVCISFASAYFYRSTDGHSITRLHDIHSREFNDHKRPLYTEHCKRKQQEAGYHNVSSIIFKIRCFKLPSN